MKLLVVVQVDPPFIEYSYVPYPPDGDVIAIIPSFAPLHDISVFCTVAYRSKGSVILNEPLSTTTQPV